MQFGTTEERASCSAAIFATGGRANLITINHKGSEALKDMLHTVSTIK